MKNNFWTKITKNGHCEGGGKCPASRQLGLRCKLSWVLCGSSGGSGSGGFIYPPHIEPPIFVSSEPVGCVINSY